jgi:glycerophosphoryl diester phosphodiesterase
MVVSQVSSLQAHPRMARVFAFTISLAIFSLACGSDPSVADFPPQLIAHSGGIGNHRTYTNSLEALDNSVARGHTAIEVDLSWTLDEHLVLLHDWGYEFEKLVHRPPGRLTLAQFRSLQSTYGLSHLDLEDLTDWMLDNPGVLVVTDIKERNIDGLRLIAEEYPKLRRRIVPQIYHPESYLEVREMGYDQVIFSLYRTNFTDQEVLDFAAENPLFAVTIPARRTMEGTLSAGLAKNGVRVYAHTVNDHPTVNALQSKGVYGVYTDWLTPGDEQNSRPLAEWWVKSEGEIALEELVVPFLPWEMAGLNTTIDLHNTGGTLEMVRLNVLDSGGRSIATNEFQILGNGTQRVNLEELVSPRMGHGWLQIEAADEITVRPRWYFLGGVEGVWASERVAGSRFETGGSGSGLGGVLVAVVNPTDSSQSYQLRRHIGGDLIDDDGVDLEPGHQLLRIYRSQTDEDLRLLLTGGPMVTQVLRWDPLGRFMR